MIAGSLFDLLLLNDRLIPWLIWSWAACWFPTCRVLLNLLPKSWFVLHDSVFADIVELGELFSYLWGSFCRLLLRTRQSFGRLNWLKSFRADNRTWELLLTRKRRSLSQKAHSVYPWLSRQAFFLEVDIFATFSRLKISNSGLSKMLSNHLLHCLRLIWAPIVTILGFTEPFAITKLYKNRASVSLWLWKPNLAWSSRVRENIHCQCLVKTIWYLLLDELKTTRSKMTSKEGFSTYPGNRLKSEPCTSVQSHQFEVQLSGLQWSGSMSWKRIFVFLLRREIQYNFNSKKYLRQ